MSNYREKKEELKEKMIRTALHFWNIKNVDNLDPLVRLLIEALSEQLYLLSNEMLDLENRVMQRLSEVLLPESVSKAKPAHAIAYIEPKWEDTETNIEKGFFSKIPFLGSEDQHQYTFFPVCKTPLYQGGIKKVIFNGDVYEIQKDLTKRIIHTTSSEKKENKIWIGLAFDNPVRDINNLSFFINFPNIIKKDEYLKALQYAQWRYRGEKLHIKNGIYIKNQQIAGENTLDYFFENQEFSIRMDSQTLEYYAPHYFTIEQSLDVCKEDYSYMPISDDSIQIQQENTPTDTSEKLLWLEIIFPEQFNSEILENIQITINAVPVANKRLHSIQKNTYKDWGIIPLEMGVGESFLGVISVYDDKNQLYTRSHGFKIENAQNTYTLRQGGSESFDNRNAHDFLVRLENLLEDEGSFFIMGKKNEDATINLIKSAIKQIHLQTSSMEKNNNAEHLHYIFLDEAYQTNFFVKYWTTLGNLANGIRVNTPLSPQTLGEHNYIEHSFLVTPSVGGTTTPSERERIAQFKYLLNGRGRVVTNHDIKTFCLAEFPDLISDVRIQHGVSVGESPQQGLIRTIDVYLIPISNIEDKQHTIEHLHKQLIKYSPMTFHYRVFID